MTPTENKVLAFPRLRGSGEPPDNDSMTSVTREELDAKLDALRSDMHAGNADLRSEFHAMRADVANTRAAMAQELAGVATVVGELKGSLDGVKTGLTTVQWLVGALLGAAALYVGIAQFVTPPQTPAAAQPPIIINVPAAAAQPSPQPAPQQ